MYKLFIIFVVSIAYSNAQTQNTGTLKISKKTEEKKSTPHKRPYLLRLGNTFAGKSSPKSIRDYEFKIGTIIGLIDLLNDRHYVIRIGTIIGKSQPNINYKGYSLGAFAQYDYRLTIGPTYIFLPVVEISYKRIFNSLELKDLNQYSAGIGFSVYIPFHQLPGIHLTFMEHYRYDTNSEDTFKGFYPSISLDYRF